ncbi:sensor histidine kinase [Cohnella hashimotonis]|uniref:histidine kinase n=1 Tax=Cohnella hashimotonis TaxID=2826895 RepID=A0ABT6TA97_9BACL|nr:sensor histidine kinase [Cohnella hashimotonis]MDI4643694.1 histidine kinase [Cohnella hashimotonis]
MSTIGSVLQRPTVTSSLKSRLFLVLLLSSLLPLLLIGSVTYYSMFLNLQNKIQKSIEATLAQVCQGIEYTLNNLDYTSRQLAFADGQVGSDLQLLFSSRSTSEKFNLTRELENNLLLLNFTNPNIGMTFYYLADTGKPMFENLEVNPDIRLENLPALSRSRGITFHGPHKSVYRYGQNTVFSIMRKVENLDHMYVYIETNYQLFEQLLNKQQYQMDVAYLLVDQDGKIVYSDRDQEALVGSAYLPESDAAGKGLAALKGYYRFEQDSGEGWKLVVAVRKSDFSHEIKQWFRQALLIVALCLSASLLLAWLIWKMVYRPIQVLGREIRAFDASAPDERITKMNVREFDHLLYHFRMMRIRIRELLLEVEQKEKRKREIEVEKLYVQINPHFLHNTLNTIQWLAKANGQTEIDRFVAVFSRVLHYNLGKEGGIVRMENELEALQHYIDLQRTRYNYQFEVRVDVDPATYKVPIPRFILQPLVENALYHGLGDEGGMIAVTVRMEEDDHASIAVTDDGVGMSPADLERLMGEGTERKVGIGIGLQFVNKTMQFYYGEAYRLHIASEPGKGTSMRLRFPVRATNGLE